MKCLYKPNGRSNIIDFTKYKIYYLSRYIEISFSKKLFNDNKFVFIVGCGNSGTTLINARLSLNKVIYSIPNETSWFIPKTPFFAKAINEIKEHENSSKINGKNILVEKTPKHIHCISFIDKFFDNKNFIFMIRNPFSNISSLKNRFNSFEQALDRYIIDNEVLVKNHNIGMLVKYEELVDKSEDILRQVCRYLNVSWDNKMVDCIPTLYNEYNFNSNDNMSIRKEQVSKSIYKDKMYTVDHLTNEEIDLIYFKTKDLIGEIYNNLDEIYYGIKSFRCLN